MSIWTIVPTIFRFPFSVCSDKIKPGWYFGLNIVYCQSKWLAFYVFLNVKYVIMSRQHQFTNYSRLQKGSDSLLLLTLFSFFNPFPRKWS